MITSNLKKIMEEKGITIRAMARDSGLSDMTILRARKKQISQCRLCTLEIIAEYLGCKIKDLFDES
ncbi:MAG: helix-turn-helix transcriptional regulator [Desulfovibrionaceae bacterium]|nr:helix-turn-helix transcriptional regulator [Desulfovibrionaceae bacterium]